VLPLRSRRTQNLSADAIPPMISYRLVEWFVEAALREVGADMLPAVLEENHLSPSVLEKNALTRPDGVEAAQIYALLQQALRLYYGRGARGILLRIGQGMWERMVAQAGLRMKTELEIARRLPVPARRRRILDVVASQLREGGGVASVHTLDLDLLLVDSSSAATARQSSAEPICFATVGLIQGALTWATGQDVDVEEVACKAAGATACEFKVRPGGK
jgi:predicted hydrocarbon binding protein